jgi:hypothetical protein
MWKTARRIGVTCFCVWPLIECPLLCDSIDVNEIAESVVVVTMTFLFACRYWPYRSQPMVRVRSAGVVGARPLRSLREPICWALWRATRNHRIGAVALAG